MAVGGEMERDDGRGEGSGEVGRGGPKGKGWPVGDGVGDYAGFVLRYEVTEELERSGRRVKAVHGVS